MTGGSIAAVGYHEFEVFNSRTKFIEEEAVPPDSLVAGYTWSYVNKSGGPDRRFSSNRRIPVCVYGELSFQSQGGLNCKIQYSNPTAADRLCSVIGVLHGSTAEFPKSIVYIKMAKASPSIVLLSLALLFALAQIAFLPNAFTSAARQIPASILQVSTPVQKIIPIISERSNDRRFQDYNKPTAAPIAAQDVRPMESFAHDPLVGAIPLPRPRPKF